MQRTTENYSNKAHRLERPMLERDITLHHLASALPAARRTTACATNSTALANVVMAVMR